MRIIVSERMLDAFKEMRTARACCSTIGSDPFGNMTKLQSAELKLARIAFDAIESECIEVATTAGEQSP